MAVTEEAPTTKRERWTMQWKELYDEVVTTGLCTGCSGCVIACPHDVLGYNDEEGIYKPFHLEEELGPANCGHGERGEGEGRPDERDGEHELSHESLFFGARPRPLTGT